MIATRPPKLLENGLYAEVYSWVSTPGMPRGWLTPVLLARMTHHGGRETGYYNLHVKCPYCGREHTHGGTRRPLGVAGFRVPHCAGDAPWALDKRASYIVAVRDPSSGSVVTVGSPDLLHFTLIAGNSETPPGPRLPPFVRRPPTE